MTAKEFSAQALSAEAASTRGRRFPLRPVLLALVVIGLSAAAFAALSRTPLLAIRSVDVVGINRLSVEEVRKATLLQPGASMVSVDEAAVERRLQELPWIAQAEVHSQYPRTVTVSIVEHAPLALVQTSDKRWAQLDGEGTVLTVSETPVPGLPAVLGVTVAPVPGSLLDPTAADLLNVARILPNSLRPHVLQMLIDPNGIRLGLDFGTIVELGDSRQLSEKLMAAAAVLSHADPKSIAVLDVRSPHLPVATPTAAAMAAKRP